MIYTNWGGTGDRVSKLGFGTTRFPTADLQGEEGISRCVELVRYALEKGVNYFDVAPTYACGYAEKILGLALKNTRGVFVSAKSGLLIDHTADQLRGRLENSLEVLHRESIDYYHIWSVMDMNQYYTIMANGGLYEGALKAREEGLIKHLCISLHTDTEDALKIIEDGCFEGITISMNAMNYEKWLPVIHQAKLRKMGVATMNSLAGGVIPRYGKLFESLDKTKDSVSVKALRYLARFPDVDICLSGMSDKEQVAENCSAFSEETSMQQESVKFKLPVSESLCSGCNYCAPCTVGIPISSMMQSYNHKILVDSMERNEDEKEMVNEVFIHMRAQGVDPTNLNRCISCGKCERKCTQKIDIRGRLKQLYALQDKYHYTREHIKEKYAYLEKRCNCYKKIGLYPACGYSTRILNLWNNKEFEKKFEYYNSSPAVWNSIYRGKKVHGPNHIVEDKVEAVLITNYYFQNEIHTQLSEWLPDGIEIIDFFEEGDINWFDRYVR